ncbi:MAG: DEAD/DEAH box helicase [Cyanobacterium sp. T60_A2020_053]|nr:DEAD/DEAH box helicase [Cyanobacterium sp. T60_A2020_053]
MIATDSVKNKEKRKLVTITLTKNPIKSDRAIAKTLGKVSHTYVGKIRKELEQQGKILFVSPQNREQIGQLPLSSISPTPDLFKLLENEVKRLPTEGILLFKKEVERLITTELESRRDNSLENAILVLARNCDGASSEDGKGFNKIDFDYGHWLAEQINSGNKLTKPIAQKAHSMLKKYHGQVTVSPWSDIAHQYPEPLLIFKEDEKSLKLAGDKIAVIFPYDPNLVKLVKSISPRGKFNGQDKNWYFSHSACLALVKTFTPHDFNIDPNLEGLIAYQQAEELERQKEEIRKQKEAEQEAQQTANKLFSFINQIDLDKPLANGWTLFQHQKEGIKWLLSRQKKGILRGGILADHMGLGKTIQTLIAGKHLSEHYNNCPIFVICPASLRDNWAKEAEMVGIKIETFSWAKLPQPLEKEYIIIADEAHYAQNTKSKRTQSLLALANNENCIATWLLTGTPLKNGQPSNLFPLLLACNHDLAKDKTEYELRYCNGQKGWGGSWDISGASHLDELAQKTEDVILRRTKKQCLDLPPKIRTNKQCLLPTKLNKEYLSEIDYYIADYQRRVIEGEVSENAEALVTVNILRKTGSKYKVDTTLELAQELLEEGEQVVIFTEFRDSALQLHDKLGGELLLGDTPQGDRQAIVDCFQSGQSKVFVGSIKAGGVGITLTASSSVILHDRPWTPGDAEQAEDRCNRIGQQNTVNSYWIQLGQIDQLIDSTLSQKQERIDLVLKGKRKTLRGIKSTSDLAKELISLLSKNIKKTE